MRERDIPQSIGDEISLPDQGNEMRDLRQQLLRDKRGESTSLRRYFAGALHDIGKSQ